MASFTENEVSYGDANKIAYITAGPEDGPLLILIHGWPAIAKTWKPQLNTFASLGFRVVAPDMPGYGKSTARKVTSDYAHENIVPGLLAMLQHVGRDQAIWIGHDWGAGVVWSLAATHPEVCKGVVNMTVPYRVLELGLEEILKYGVNRDTYPEDQYPNGQWDYQAYYEQSFDEATEWFDKDIGGVLKMLYSKGSPGRADERSFTSTVVKDGGWFGGRSKMPKPPSADQLPGDKMCIDQETYSELVAAMEKTGFYPADAYYMNHKSNRAYNLENSVENGLLTMPVLFIEAAWDVVCDTRTTRLCEPMRRLCTNLSEVSIDAGHWVYNEQPEKVNAALAGWIVEQVREWWPAHVKARLS